MRSHSSVIQRPTKAHDDTPSLPQQQSRGVIVILYKRACSVAVDCHRRELQRKTCFSFFLQPYRSSPPHLQVKFRALQSAILLNITSKPFAIRLLPSYRTRPKYISLVSSAHPVVVHAVEHVNLGKLRLNTPPIMNMNSSQATRCLLALLNLALPEMSAGSYAGPTLQ